MALEVSWTSVSTPGVFPACLCLFVFGNRNNGEHVFLLRPFLASFKYRKGLEVFVINWYHREELLLSYSVRGHSEFTIKIRLSPHVSSPETMFGFKMCLSEGLHGLWKSGGLAYSERS